VLSADQPTGAWVLALGFGIPVVLQSWAFMRARAVMPAALREVAALDQERLAHVDLVTPSRLEQLFLRCWSPPIRNLLSKDISLLRRRYPLGYFLFVVCLGILWLLLWLGRSLDSPWLLGSVLLFGVHTGIMAWRSANPPTEEPVLLRSLPMSMARCRQAKRGYGCFRLWVFLILGATPLLTLAAFSLSLLGFFMVVAVLGTVGIYIAASDNSVALR
jgi:hypothetical protein